MLTIREALGELAGLKLVFVGDGNNVARSLALASAFFGVEFVLACPVGYEFPGRLSPPGSPTQVPRRPLDDRARPEGRRLGADVVYTDVWASMGQEDEVESRKAVFEPYRVNATLLALRQARRRSSSTACPRTEARR